MISSGASEGDCAGGCASDGARRSAGSRIFEAARDLFYRRGIRAVGVDEIVCEAGVTKPSLYRAYRSKDELVAACLVESARENGEALRAAINSAGDDPRARLRAVGRFYAAQLAQPGFRGCPLSNVAVELPEPGHPGRAVVESCKSELRALVVSLTRALPVVDPEALADGLILIVEGAFATHHIFGSQGPSQVLEATWDALIDSRLERMRV